MPRRWIAGLLAAGFILNLFISPISILVYEVNQKIQAGSDNRFKEISITICTTSCTIQKTMMVEQSAQTQATPPVKVLANFLTVYWQDIDVFQFVDKWIFEKLKPHFIDPFIPGDFTNAVFVPPKVIV